MKARAWQRFFEEQRRVHGKVVFTVTELANVAGCSRNAVNVELSRLRRHGDVSRYARGLYGLPGGVTAEGLLPHLDDHAYVTGMSALRRYNLVTQWPTVTTCFTNRYGPRGRDRETAAGRLRFVCVRGHVYTPPARGCVAGPEQALCDFVYLCRRRALETVSLVTLRNLHTLDEDALQRVLPRYPRTVRGEVRRLVDRAPCDAGHA
jgi:hypothetical protein